MRHARPFTLLLILATALLTGCGGNQITADEVPLEPPALSLPDNPDAAPGAGGGSGDVADADADADATPTPEADAAGTTSGGTSSGGTAPGSTGGTTPPPAATPTPAATQAPAEDTGGAQADEGLDQFCADNPGAC